jgi:Rieske 2Fe-2S family protein
MQRYDRAAIERLIAARRPNHGLPAELYTAADVYAADMELIYARHWLFVASEAEIPEAGDYVTVQIGNNPIFVVRDDDERVRAYHNVCRHRGSRLLLDPKGITGNLVCPYHQWTYDLAGKLIHAELMPSCVGAGTHDLKPVATRTVCGLIYVCLAANPPDDFDELATELAPYLTPHGLSRTKVAHQNDLIEPGNWKITIENNRECYHCGGHPELLRSLFHFFGEYDIPDSQKADWDRYQRTLAEMRTIWDDSGLPWRPVEKLAGRPTGYRFERLALEGPGESYTMDVRRACRKLLGGFTNARLGSLHMHTQPNAWFHFLGDHAVTFAVFPQGPDRTLVRTTWLVDRDAVEGVDYDIENLTRVWNTTNAQDAGFVAWQHGGALSQAYEPGPLAANEYMVDLFGTWYTERMAAGLAG